MKFREWLLELIEESDNALKEDAENSRQLGMGETTGKLYRNQTRFDYPRLSAIWKLDGSSRRLEKLTIVLAFLTVLLLIRTLIP